MITPEKLNKALRAVQLVIIHARFMAYRNEPHQQIAHLLDYAEELPAFIMDPSDKTEKFRQALEGLVADHPKCYDVIYEYDSNI